MQAQIAALGTASTTAAGGTATLTQSQTAATGSTDALVAAITRMTNAVRANVVTTEENTAAIGLNTTFIDANTASSDALVAAHAATVGAISAETAALETNTGAIQNNTAQLDLNSVASDKASASAERQAAAHDSLIGSLGKVGATLGVVAGGLAIYGAGFDAAMLKVQDFAGVSSDQIAGLKQQITDLSSATGEAPKKLAEGLYYAASAGFNAADAMKILDQSTRLAMAAHVDAKPVVDIVTSALRAYNEPVSQASHYLDVLTVTTRDGKLEFGQLADAMGRALPVAAATGVGIETLGGTIAALTQKGLNVNEAVTAITRLLTGVEAPTAQTRKAFYDLGTSADEVRASIRDRGLLQTIIDLTDASGGNLDKLKELFPNIRSLTAALSLVKADGGDAANKVMADFATNTGIAQKASDDFAHSTQGHFDQLKGAALSFAADAGSALAHMFDGPAQRATDFFKILDAGLPGHAGQSNPIDSWAKDHLPGWLQGNPFWNASAGTTPKEPAFRESATNPSPYGAASPTAGADLANAAAITSSATQTAEAMAHSTDKIKENAAALGLHSEKAFASHDALSKLNSALGALKDSTTAHQVAQDLLNNSTQALTLSTTEADARSKKLADTVQFGSGALKENAQALIDMDTAVATLGVEGTKAALAHQQLIDTLAKTPSTGAELVTTLDAIQKGLHGTAAEAEAAIETTDKLLNKPSREENAVKSQIDALKLATDQWHATLSASSPIDQYIAKLEETRLKQIEEGASTDAVTKTTNELKANLAQVPAAEGAAIIAGADHAHQNEITSRTLTDQLNVLKDHRTSLQDTVTLIHSSAVPSMSDLDTAVGGVSTAFSGVVTAGTPMKSLLGEISGAFQAVAGAAGAAAGTVAGFSSMMGGVVGGPGGGGSMRFPATGGSAFGMPVDNWQSLITQGFGPTSEQLEPAYGGYAHFHEGIDLGVGMGTPLHAGGSGRVIQAGANGGYGNSVTIDLGNGLTELLGHLDTIAVKIGDLVTQGQTVGLSGNTGASTGPHVHVQVMQNGVPIDPTSVLGTVLGGQPGGTTSATLNIAGQGSSIGGLPASWYAAIQASESSLPLPSDGSPQPMFGFGPGAQGNVGTGHYRSGGTAAGSAGLGAEEGWTYQSLFPSVQTGVATLDAWWQRYPDAVAAVQSGDFNAFLSSLINHGYAGPGEWGTGPRTSAPVLGSGNVAAFSGGSGSASGSYGTPGQMPVPSPSGGAPVSAATADLDLFKADRGLDHLQDAASSLQATHLQAQAGGLTGASDADIQSFESSYAKIPDLLAKAQAAQAAYNALVASGSATTKQLSDANKELQKAYGELSDAESDATKAQTKLTEDINAGTTATNALTTTNTHLAEVESGVVTASTQDMTQARLDADKAAADSAQATAITRGKAAQEANQKVLDDIQNGVEPAVLKADQALARSATDAANASYTAWHTAESQLETDRKAFAAQQKKRQDDEVADFVAGIRAEIAANNEFANSFHNIVTMQASLAVTSAETSTAVGQGMVSAANQAVQAYITATQSVQMWDRVLNDSSIQLTDNERKVIQGYRDSAVAAQQSALQIAQAGTQAAAGYANAQLAAQSAIAQGERHLFDLKHTLTHLSGEEQAAGLAQIISAEIDFQTQIDNIENEIANTADETQRHILEATLHRLQQELAAQEEAEREKRVMMQDTAKAASSGGGGGGGPPIGGGGGNNMITNGFVTFTPGPNGTWNAVDVNGGVAARGTIDSSQAVILQNLAAMTAPGGYYDQLKYGPGGGPGGSPHSSNVSVVVQLDGKVIAEAVQHAQTQNMNLNVSTHA